MIVKRPVGEKGQIVIPRDMREMFGIRGGEIVLVEAVEDGIKIKKERDPEELVEEFFNTPKLKKKLSTRQLKEIIYEQYNEEIP